MDVPLDTKQVTVGLEDFTNFKYHLPKTRKFEHWRGWGYRNVQYNDYRYKSGRNERVQRVDLLADLVVNVRHRALELYPTPCRLPDGHGVL